MLLYCKNCCTGCIYQHVPIRTRIFIDIAEKEMRGFLCQSRPGKDLVCQTCVMSALPFPNLKGSLEIIQRFRSSAKSADVLKLSDMLFQELMSMLEGVFNH